MIWIKNKSCYAFSSKRLGESGVVIVEDIMTTLRTVTIAAVLLVGGASLAMAQNGPATGGQSPVAGGANGSGSAYGQVYRYGYRHLYAYSPYHHRYRHWRYY